MAVYTHLSSEDMIALLAQYNIGELVSFEGIITGIENTNYHLVTTKGRYVLTLFEKRVDPRDLPFFFAFMNHLAKQKIDVPFAIINTNNQIIQKIKGKSAVIISYLAGRGVLACDITPDLCKQMGALTAQLHVGAINFTSSRSNAMGLAAWKDLFDKIKLRLHEIDLNLEAIVRGQFKEFEAVDFKVLPRAVVHADLFPDNIFIQNDQLCGVIDFYFSCTDFLGYDLALTMNAWCFNEKGQCDPERLINFISEYELIRPMAPDEKRMMNLFFRMAAVRILLTRAHDWLFHDPAALVTPKNPLEYLNILNYHIDHRVL